MKYKIEINGRKAGRLFPEHRLKDFEAIAQLIERAGWDAEIVKHVPRKRRK